MDGVDILQVITSAAPRGAERFAVMLEPELEARGLVTRTVALHAGPNPGLDVPLLGKNTRGFDTVRSLRRAARSASLVVAHGSATLPATAIATAFSGIPFLYRNIGDPYYWASTARRRWTTRLFLDRADHVVALTPEAKRRVVECYRTRPSKIDVIPNGVPAEEFRRRTDRDHQLARQQLNVPADCRILVTLGALSSEKDVATAVQAMRKLPEHWMLLVAGDGPERQSVEKLAADVGIDRVRFLGQVKDPVAVLHAADLLVLTSLTEGLPGVIIEAAMIGIPAVASDTGFVRDLVENGVTGYVVPTAAPGAVAEAVLLAEAHLDRLGAAAHERAMDRYAMSIVADQWAGLLRRVRDPDTALARDAKGIEGTPLDER